MAFEVKISIGRPEARWWAVLEARWLRFRSTVESVGFPEESHCDQCDLQGVCTYLHGLGGSKCKAYPKVYHLKARWDDGGTRNAEETHELSKS